MVISHTFHQDRSPVLSILVRKVPPVLLDAERFLEEKVSKWSVNRKGKPVETFFRNEKLQQDLLIDVVIFR